MKCCLWLNGKKVKEAAEIEADFDLTALKGYLCGGSLIEWLRDNGGEDKADFLKKALETDDIDTALKLTFGVITKENKQKSNVEKTLEIIMTTVGKVDYRVNANSSTAENTALTTQNCSFFNSFYSSGVGLPNNSFFSSSLGFYTSGGSFSLIKNSFSASSFNIGSFSSSFGSYRIMWDPILYRTLQLHLSSCPLNKYGYGINLI